MSETHYLISDTSKKVDVPSHVLRYWEEELEMNIPRNEMGHRYYTQEDIDECGLDQELLGKYDEFGTEANYYADKENVAYELKKNGVPLPDGILRKEELMEALLPLLA